MKQQLAPFAATAVIQLANLASGILAARLLLPEGRGELAAVILLSTILASLGGMSINVATAYFAARERDRVCEIFGAATALSAGLSLVLVVIGLAVVPLAYRHQSPEVRDLARIYLAFVPINLFALCYLAIPQGRLNTTLFHALRSLMPSSYVGLILVAGSLGAASVAGFVAASLGANALVLGSALLFLLLRGWARLSAPIAMVKALAHFAVRSHVGYAVAIVGQRLDQALIALILAPADLGQYAVALSSGGAAALVGGTVELIAFPKVAGARDKAAQAAAVARYARLTTALAVLTAAVLIPLLPWLIELFFGAAFRPAAATSQIIALAAVPLCLKMAIYAGLRGAGLPLAVGRIEAAVLVTLAAALAVLLPRFGIEGCAWSLFAANALGCALAAARVRRELGLALAALVLPNAEDLRRLGALARLGRG